MAMEARCYRGGDGRTRMKEINFSTKDYVASTIIVIYLGVIVAMRWVGI